MAVIHTQRNMVCAMEPLDRDSWVETLTAGDGTYHRLTLQPIDQYQTAVDWAVSIADEMAGPLHIVPIDAADLASRYGERIDRAFARLTDQERGELRRVAINTCAEVMRDCPEPEVRADAFDVLAKMGVVSRC